MVPFHTILALLAVLVALSSCTQVAPPQPGKEAEKQAQLANPKNTHGTGDPKSGGSTATTPGEKTDGGSAKPGDKKPYIDMEWYTLEKDGIFTLGLNGADAEKIFNLMSVASTKTTINNLPAETKAGSQFSCTKDSLGYGCVVPVKVADGAVRVAISIDRVIHADSTSDQSKLVLPKNTFLKIAQGENGKNKVRLWSKEERAEKLYEALQGEELTLTADQKNGPGTSKIVNDTECYKTDQPSTDPSAKKKYWYSCYFYLDVAKGTVDKVSVGKLFY